MGLNPSSLRIGVVDQTVSGWTAAAVYSRMTLRSLELACQSDGPQLYFLTNEVNGERLPQTGATPVQVAGTDYLPAERQFRKLLHLPEKSSALRGEPRLRKLLGLSAKSDIFGIAQEHKIDVLLPLLDIPPWKVDTATIGWIPDFQHSHIPQFFTEDDLQKRISTVRRLAEQATIVMLSSNAARDDFAVAAPAHVDKARVVSFPSLLTFEELRGDPASTRIKFNLPEKFALVANQFWAHKNHALVVSALAELHKVGMEVPVVMTGMPSDYRDPSNKNLSDLLQAIARAGLQGKIFILGLVPYGDLVNLMRTAALIIQPSRFEGWSTVVQDAVALGRPLFCSDIPVHREQVPGALGFFGCDEPTALADLIANHWKNLTPGPDQETEHRSLALGREFSLRHGRTLVDICVEAAAAHYR
jgi:glycosyltransferase involved in cell wall biosynthesis